MEWYFAVLLSALSATFMWIFAARVQPKNKHLADLNRYYDEIITGLKTELRRERAKVGFYKRGATPQSTEGMDRPEDVIDAVLNALPPNFKPMIAPFRSEIMKYAKENPEAVQAVVEVIKQKAMKGNQEDAITNDSL